MNNPKYLMWGAGLCLTLAAAPLCAQGSGYGYGPMAGGSRWQGQNAYCGPWSQSLALTDSQQTKLNAIEGRHQPSLDAKLKAAADARFVMQQALRDPSVSDARIKELRDQVADAQTAVLLERRAMDREAESVLTADQRTILKQRPQGGYGQGWGMGYGCMAGACGMGPSRGRW